MKQAHHALRIPTDNALKYICFVLCWDESAVFQKLLKKRQTRSRGWWSGRGVCSLWSVPARGCQGHSYSSQKRHNRMENFPFLLNEQEKNIHVSKVDSNLYLCYNAVASVIHNSGKGSFAIFSCSPVNNTGYLKSASTSFPPCSRALTVRRKPSRFVPGRRQNDSVTPSCALY